MHMLDPATPDRTSPAVTNLMRRAVAPVGTDNVPDLLLLERARAHEPAAIEALVRRYARRLFRVAHSVTADGTRAEAIVQETYFGAFSDLTRYEATGKFAAWLTRLTYQQARSQRTVAVRTAPAAVTEPAMPAPDTELRALEVALARLPEVFRTVFVLRMIEGISGIETAASLGLHETTVRTRLYRAHRRLGTEAEQRMRSAAGFLELPPARVEQLVARVLAQLPRRALTP
jgi:RNA polymerase sigma-70 factor, ECF subfamily